MLLNLIFKVVSSLEAFPVNNGWTTFIIFLFGDPHLLEGGEGRQNGASNPYRVFPFWISNTRVHGGASGHDSVGIKILPDVNITLHDRVIGGLMNATGFHSKE